MGLFDLFRKSNQKVSDELKQCSAKEEISAERAIQTIAVMISEEDNIVLQKIEACLGDPEAYFHTHADAFLERGIEKFDEIPLRKMQWIAMVDILVENGYVCERDWKDELEDFLYFIGELKATKRKALPLEAEWFDAQEDISKWCPIVDEKWNPFGMCLATIDLESDCYVLFPCEKDELKALDALAKRIAFRIC